MATHAVRAFVLSFLMFSMVGLGLVSGADSDNDGVDDARDSCAGSPFVFHTLSQFLRYP